MKKTPISDRLRYAFDNVMSRGIIGLIAWLALISVSVVLVTSVVVWFTEISTERSLAEQFWAYLAQTVKATPMTDRPWLHRLPQLVITYTGLFVTGALIGILTSAQISINPHRSNTGQSRHRPPRPFSQHPPQVLATGLSGLISSMRLSTRSCKVGRNLREARDVKIDIRSEAASYYDLSPQHPKDIPFYEDRIPSPDASILELGCGTGRVLVPLAASCGYIHGLDLSEAMIAVCLRRLREAGTEPGKACAEVGDITDFSLGWRFDLITAPFRVLQNLETDEEVDGLLRCVREHLSPQGTCILNVFNPNRDRGTMIRLCEPSDHDTIHTIINDAAYAYKSVIPADRWSEPYMSKEELGHENDAGVVFWGYEENGQLLGVIGLQHVSDVSLIRHAYVRSDRQQQGIGGKLLRHLLGLTDRPILIGTWASAEWAIQFYEKHGFRLVSPQEKDRLLRRYWTIPERQIETSVVLVGPKWSARGVGR